jgi:hypothetical protein
VKVPLITVPTAFLIAASGVWPAVLLATVPTVPRPADAPQMCGPSRHRDEARFPATQL